MHRYTQARAQVGLRHDAGKRHQHEAEGLDVLARVVQPAAVARHDAGVQQDDRDLGELARLDLYAQLEPRLRAHARVGSQPRYVGREDERHVDDEEQHGEVRQAAVVEPPDQHHEHDSQRDARQLVRERVVAVVGHGRHHDDEPVRHQQRHHEDERDVEPREASRARGLRHDLVGRFH